MIKRFSLSLDNSIQISILAPLRFTIIAYCIWANSLWFYIGFQNGVYYETNHRITM